MSNNKSNVNRRTFLSNVALGTLGTISIPTILTGCSRSAAKDVPLREIVVPEFLDKAPDGKPLKAGLVGCGDRGTGAAVDFLRV